jgi:hypothetical protein
VEVPSAASFVTSTPAGILKFYCKLKNDEDKAAATKDLEDAAVGFCVHATATTPPTTPVKLGSAADMLEHANQYIYMRLVLCPRQSQHHPPSHVCEANLSLQNQQTGPAMCYTYTDTTARVAA